MSSSHDPYAPADSFARRHIGDDDAAVSRMLRLLGYPSLDALAEAAVPAAIRRGPLKLPPAAGESAALGELREIAGGNKVYRSFIGLGYHDTLTPPVIQRAIFENPGWYTSRGFQR
jgi:glycine dehydrogenase